MCGRTYAYIQQRIVHSCCLCWSNDCIPSIYSPQTYHFVHSSFAPTVWMAWLDLCSLFRRSTRLLHAGTCHVRLNLLPPYQRIWLWSPSLRRIWRMFGPEAIRAHSAPDEWGSNMPYTESLCKDSTRKWITASDWNQRNVCFIYLFFNIQFIVSCLTVENLNLLCSGLVFGLRDYDIYYVMHGYSINFTCERPMCSHASISATPAVGG